MRRETFASTIAWYDQNAISYSRATESIIIASELLEFTELLPPGASVLDAGCGSGRDSTLLTNKGFRVIGLDISACLTRLNHAKFPTIPFVQGNFLILPFPNNSFSGVWANAALVHLESPEDAQRSMDEFSRVLEVGGILHILVKAQTGDCKTSIVADKLSGHNRFFRYYTTDEIRRMTEGSGPSSILLEEYLETDKNPDGRHEVRWIRCLARKL